MQMREKLDYVYYRFYSFQAFIGHGIDAVPTSILFLSTLITFNFFGIGCLLYGFGVVKIPPQSILPGVISLFTCSIIINCLLFIKKARYKHIIKIYKNETEIVAKKENLWVVLYILVTFIFLGLGFYLMVLRNNQLP